MIRLSKQEAKVYRLEQSVKKQGKVIVELQSQLAIANARWLHSTEERNVAEAIIEKQKLQSKRSDSAIARDAATRCFHVHTPTDLEKIITEAITEVKAR